ncbi:MAG: dihydroneopterin aldolase [Francisellaceae bacterium]|jgi:7,8-dihydroneopterin aldolase/epimerase/oxygenase|nr:dihydroneopterin aldolase [Francisellaceae bacterium]MBT6207533.1 dihydroneopterin aldolase [Francisellaceae bacterium]MBT6538392.1 dihydroneopterin aldolase [Francisellaceae bacterium]
MADTVIIKGLKVPTTIGIHPWERTIKQTLILHLELESPSFSKIANYDEIDQALDYQKVSEWIQQFSRNNSYKLVETFISKLSDELANEFSIPKIVISLEKHQAIENANFVGVQLERNYNF